MGFRLVGIYEEVGYKFGQWWDVGWWSLALQAKPSADPTDPLKPDVARALPGWQDALDTGLSLLR